MDLTVIESQVRAALELRDSIREQALRHARELIRLCSVTIKHVHRRENQSAQTALQQAEQITTHLRALRETCPDIYFAGYVQDAMKEYAEAHLTMALIDNRPLPDPATLAIEAPAYINGLAEAGSECRRQILDLLRSGQMERAERLLEQMDDIYYMLATLDFPDAVTAGLRRTVDAFRAVLERTRGDVTITAVQRTLQQALDTASAVNLQQSE